MEGFMEAHDFYQTNFKSIVASDLSLVDEQRDIIIGLEARVSELVDALVWCSGSPDFGPGGQARAGWLKVVGPLLNRK
jgi:hypothetical protein